jgi:hypothetical protein
MRILNHDRRDYRVLVPVQAMDSGDTCDIAHRQSQTGSVCNGCSEQLLSRLTALDDVHRLKPVREFPAALVCVAPDRFTTDWVLKKHHGSLPTAND